MYLVFELRWKSWKQEAGVEEGRVASASEEVCILAQFGTQDRPELGSKSCVSDEKGISQSPER